MMRESTYQLRLLRILHEMFPGCFVLKNDSSYVQGVPDLIVLYNDTWAMLEVKLDAKSDVQPNQEHYVQLFNEMSFASFINPEIEEDVLYELQQAFRLIWEARVS